MSNDFDDLNMPNDDFGTPPSEGMPDPTAQDQTLAETQPEAASEEAEPALAAKPKSDKGGLLAKVTETDLYTVMLAISLAAVLIAILCLMVEWGTYGFERHAKISAATFVSPQATVCLETGAASPVVDHVVG